MMLVGVDLRTRDQSIAMVDTETGETRELRLRHEGRHCVTLSAVTLRISTMRDHAAPAPAGARP